MKDLTIYAALLLSLMVHTHQGTAQPCPTDCNSSNSIVGVDAGDSISTGSSNSFLGFRAGENNKDGSSNSFFGRSAGENNKDGSSNSFFGRSAGESSTSSNNAFFGASAGRNTTSGHSNSFFGSSAGTANTIAINNSFFGRLAGTSTGTGAGNAFFGSSAGRNNLNGGSNAFFGYLAGFENTSGSSNAFFGRSAGNNLLGSRNICIGNQAGPEPPDSNSSDRLYIDVETSSDPLIYGEFDNDFVRVNGTFEVTAGLMNPSSIELKTNFNPVDHQAVMEKLAALHIMEWTYKGQPGVVHIGPVAEDFHSSFAYGTEAQIFTMDADGITMAAVKALHEENLRQQEQIERLESKIAELETLLKSGDH